MEVDRRVEQEHVEKDLVGPWMMEADQKRHRCDNRQIAAAIATKYRVAHVSASVIGKPHESAAKGTASQLLHNSLVTRSVTL
jgi:hypothetical protein